MEAALLVIWICGVYLSAFTHIMIWRDTDSVSLAL